MKIAIIFSRPDSAVIFRRGRQNKEFYKQEDIDRAAAALRERGHETLLLESDTSIISELQKHGAGLNNQDYPNFMVLNLAYGVQGANRYSHIPGLLEMLGVPYAGSGPRAHTLSIDKFTANALVRQAGVATPVDQLLMRPSDELKPELSFPLIIKPQFESSSFGVKVVSSAEELRTAAEHIIGEFQQPALVESFIAGREINCGLLGNNPTHALPVLEIQFDKTDESEDNGKKIFDHDSKEGRQWRHVCPASISYETAAEVQSLAVRAFRVLGCRDCARVDFRVDEMGRPFFIELNSMVALHPEASFMRAASALGWSFADMLERVMGVAADRYATSGGRGHLWDGSME